MWLAMVLQRVIRQMLFVLCEHHTVHLRGGSCADQRHLLVDFGQPTAQGANRPLQGCVTIDQRFLVCEVPDPLSPVLQIDETQMGAIADN